MKSVLPEATHRHGSAAVDAGRPDFASLLRENAVSRSDDIAFRFLSRNGHGDLTWGSLFEEACRRATALRDLQGKQIGLLCNRPQDFVVSLAATFIAGAIAVPMPATLNRRSYEHVKAIISAADLAAIVAPAEALAAEWLATPSAATRRISLEELKSSSGNLAPLKHADLASPFILQFTSGSTREPRGVVLSQANVLANCESIVTAYGLGSNDIGLSWLPLHHDMGLVGHVLVPIYLGGRSVIMDPLRFLQRPLSWLEAIEREKASITSAPNFAYELCSQAASSAPDLRLNLASLSTAICGGEPVHAGTLDRFEKTFRRFGFRRKAFAPSYGLAEATLLVSSGKNADGPATVSLPRKLGGNRSCVSLGAPVGGMDVRIVNPTSRSRCGDDEVGEIEIAGPNVGKQIGTPAHHWTQTGDLGFIHQGQLCVTGRLRDMIILRGENLPPTDAEAAASLADGGLVSNDVAAIGVDEHGTQVMVIVAEVRSRTGPSLDDLGRRIREEVAGATGHVPADVVFVAVGTLPRTTSGKLRRSEIATLYTKGAFRALNVHPATTSND